MTTNETPRYRLLDDERPQGPALIQDYLIGCNGGSVHACIDDEEARAVGGLRCTNCGDFIPVQPGMVL